MTHINILVIVHHEYGEDILQGETDNHTWRYFRSFREAKDYIEKRLNGFLVY